MSSSIPIFMIRNPRTNRMVRSDTPSGKKLLREIRQWDYQVERALLHEFDTEKEYRLNIQCELEELKVKHRQFEDFSSIVIDQIKNEKQLLQKSLQEQEKIAQNLKLEKQSLQQTIQSLSNQLQNQQEQSQKTQEQLQQTVQLLKEQIQHLQKAINTIA